MSEVDTMQEAMLKLDWTKLHFDPIHSYLDRIFYVLPSMEPNYRKAYLDQAIELLKQITAGTMSPEQAKTYWRDVVVSTRDEWYARVRRQEHQDYIKDYVPAF